MPINPINGVWSSLWVALIRIMPLFGAGNQFHDKFTSLHFMHYAIFTRPHLRWCVTSCLAKCDVFVALEIKLRSNDLVA